jgi:ribosome maturation factor RimP
MLLSPEQVHAVQEDVSHAVQPVLGSDFFLIDTVFEKEFGQWYLRLYLERTNGERISLDDCALLSQKFDEPLERCQTLKDLSYTLEVSSPGLFRTLKTSRELQFYQGREVSIQCKDKTIEGTLYSYDEMNQLLFVLPNTLDDSAINNPTEHLVTIPLLESGMVIHLNPKVDALDDVDNVESISPISDQEKDTKHHD